MKFKEFEANNISFCNTEVVIYNKVLVLEHPYYAMLIKTRVSFCFTLQFKIRACIGTFFYFTLGVSHFYR